MPQSDRWPLVPHELSGRVRVFLHRHAETGCHTCPEGTTYHVCDQDQGDERDTAFPESDTRWPTLCGCGQPFGAADCKLVIYRPLVRRLSDGALIPLTDLAIGAVYDGASLLTRALPNPVDGRYLVCITPEGNWELDFCFQVRGDDGDASFARAYQRTGSFTCLTVTPEATFQDGDQAPLASFRISDGVLEQLPTPIPLLARS